LLECEATHEGVWVRTPSPFTEGIVRVMELRELTIVFSCSKCTELSRF